MNRSKLERTNMKERVMILTMTLSLVCSSSRAYEIPDGPTEDQSFEAHFLKAKQKTAETVQKVEERRADEAGPAAQVVAETLNAIDALNGQRVGMAARFIAIQPGTFQMGSPGDEASRDNDETQHSVTLTQGFEMQATPVTQMQYFLVTGRNPSNFRNRENCDPNNFRVVNGLGFCAEHPVEMVSWEDAQDFIRRLNEMQNQYTYRLPTEAEWEYAARAGTQPGFPYSFGHNDTGELDNYAWYSNNSGNRTHAVAMKRQNPWGLYDMHGNVWEWVQDWFGAYPNTGSGGFLGIGGNRGNGAVTDPKGPNTGSSRVIRGGSWYRNAGRLRSASRLYSGPGYRGSYVGFRLARSRR